MEGFLHSVQGLPPFWSSLLMVFLLELGDKTQLVSLTLATKYNARVVLLGILAATLVVHIISVILGGGMGRVIDPAWIGYAAGLAFVGFGFWTIRGDSCDDPDDEGKCARRELSPFWTVAVTFFLAELGDKTMLGTVTLATAPGVSLVSVWIGSSLGMVASDGLAIMVGQVLGKRLPERAIQVGASVIFLGVGGFKTIQGNLALPSYAWGVTVVVVAALAFLFLRKPKPQALPETAAVERERAIVEK